MPVETQTIIFFTEEGWDEESAVAWADEHDFKSDKVDTETEGQIRLRQFDPSECAEDSMSTLSEDLPDGVQFVVCEREGAESDEGDEGDAESEEEEESAERVLVMPDPVLVRMLSERWVKIETDDGILVQLRKPTSFAVEKDSSDNGKLRFTITTDRVDRMGDVVEATGWEFENFNRAGGTVLFNHEYGEVAGSPPAQGRTLEIRQFKHKVQALMEFHRKTRFNDELYQMYRGGYMKTASVGFWPLEPPDQIKDKGEEVSGLRFKRKELLEWSLVAVPANPDAVAMAMRKGLIRDRTAEFLTTLIPRGARVQMATPSRPVHAETEGDQVLVEAIGVKLNRALERLRSLK